MTDAVNAGTPKAGEFLEYLGVDVKAMVTEGRLRATTVFEDVAGCPTHLVAVPTERGGSPWMDLVFEVLARIEQRSTSETLTILVESTLTPGTLDRWLRTLFLPLGRALGSTLFVAACPRRDWFCDSEKNLETLPRVAGGVTPACTDVAVKILSRVSREILPTDYRTAELVKPLENALFHVQVAAAYEMALAFPQHNVAEALRLVGTHWRLPTLHVGLGSAGRCVPLGPRYLIGASAEDPTVFRHALERDQTFVDRVAELIDRWLDPLHPRVLILGLGYRPDFRDVGLSRGAALAKTLRAFDTSVTVHDPLWEPTALREACALPEGIQVATDAEVDRLMAGILPPSAIVLATAHRAYRDWPIDGWRWRQDQLVLDAPGAWATHRDRFHGLDYRVIGEPNWMGPAVPRRTSERI